MVKQLGLAGRHMTLAQAREHALEQRQGPLAIEQLFRREIVARLELISPLGHLHIERDRRLSAAALQSPGAVALVREEVADRRAKKGAKAPSCRIGVLEVVLLENAQEERLREVCAVFRTIPLPADECVHRVPVHLAQTGQRLR